ncbi:hypothetical protein [Sphingomonas sp.]|uniref:hypothetical protein n=1 Tax=Sphingomonas sp. TaxID=28214 RepID=UPI0035C7F4AC
MRLAAALVIACVAAAPAAAPRFTSLVPQFDAVAMRVADRPEAERVAAFKAEVAPLLPDFYRPRGAKPERWDAAVGRAMMAYPAERAKILAAARLVEGARAAAEVKFARTFPDYRATMPVYLLHSVGEMDGGTRDIAGGTALIFGADVVAKYHDASTIGALFDHELFHTHHQRFFAECPKVWCALWTEGLATHVAAQMNPGASDRALLLDFPKPIRAEVNRHWPTAIATMRAALDAEDGPVAERMFSAGNMGEGLPDRWGYYVGMRVAQRLGRTHNLATLARMKPAEVRPLIEAALKEMAARP